MPIFGINRYESHAFTPKLGSLAWNFQPNLEYYRCTFAAFTSKFGSPLLPSFTPKLGKYSPPFHFQIWNAVVSCDLLGFLIVSLLSLLDPSHPNCPTLHDKTYRQVVIGSYLTSVLPTRYRLFILDHHNNNKVVNSSLRKGGPLRWKTHTNIFLVVRKSNVTLDHDSAAKKRHS